MKIEPFKIKNEFTINYKALSLAQEIFGTPSDGCIHLFNSSLSQPKYECESNWKFYDHESIVNLTIVQIHDKDIIELTISKQEIYGDQTISINVKDYVPDWKYKLKKFIDSVKKPWNEWTEEEIMSDPMWIYFFWKSNRSISEKFHNAMVLLSYEKNQNNYIKRYFDEIKDRNSA